MSSVINPLELLRDYVLNNKVIPETNNDNITFGNLTWPKNHETNCVIFIKPPRNELQFYNLETLTNFAQNKNLHHVDYVNQARDANIIAVRRPDRRKILDYLNGVTDISSMTNVPKKKERQAGAPKNNGLAGVSKNQHKKMSRNQKRKMNRATSLFSIINNF